MSKTYLVILDPGPKWDVNRSYHDQKGWNVHSKFLDKLFLNGTILLGGPLADNSRIFLSANAKNEGELRIIFKDDPFVKSGILTLEHILEWNLQHHSELVEENE